MSGYASTTDSITLKGAYYIDISLTNAIIHAVPNPIITTIKNTIDETVTTYSGNFTISALDADENIIQVSTNGADYANTADVTPTSGVYSGNIYFNVPTGTTGPIAVCARTTAAINGYRPYGVDSVALGALTLVFTVEPSSVSRDTNFSMTVQAQDGAGTKVAAATDTITITLTPTDAADVFNSSSTTSYTAELTAGEWSTTTEQITGGDGTDTGNTIKAQAAGYVEDTTSEFTIENTPPNILVFTVEPSSSIERDSYFSITIQAQDYLGNKLTGATDTVTLTLVSPDENDKFYFTDGKTREVTLVAGEWSTEEEKIMQGSGPESGVTITAEAEWYTSGSTSEFSIVEITDFYALGDDASSWANARSEADASSLTESYQSNYFNIGWWFPGTNVLVRQGKNALINGGQTSLTAHYIKKDTNLDVTVSIQIRYSNSAPSNGADLRSGTLLTTIDVGIGDDGETGDFDASDAISDDDNIYIWSVSAADVNDSGYPAWSGASSKSGGIIITSLEFE